VSTATKVFTLISVCASLQGCGWRAPTPSAQSIAINWAAPNFRALLDAIKACQHPDLEEDADCADRTGEVREALAAVEFCLQTSLPLYACRAIQRKLIFQHAPLLDAARVVKAADSAESIELRPYYPIRNAWLSAEWRWRDRGTLIQSDKAGFFVAMALLGLVFAGLVRAIGQIPIHRFRSTSQKIQDYMNRAHQEAVEQIRMRQDEERRWLVLLHAQFEASGIDRLPVSDDQETPFADLWTAGLGTDHCGKHAVTISDCHQPTGVQLIVTSAPSRLEGEGWEFHVYFGEIQDVVRCERPASLRADPSSPDWSEFRTFQEIPWDRAEVALAVARRLLLRAMRGTELLNQRGAAVPKTWRPYPEEIPLYLAARLPEDIDDY
jgi:hypothetical protein